MRPIIFRGKRKDNGEWVEGSLIIAKNYCCILQDEEKVHPFDYPYLGNESGCIDGYATPVIPETVGQFTGLTDKNGKKIFEGDIVKNRCCVTLRSGDNENKWDCAIMGVVTFRKGGFWVKSSEFDFPVSNEYEVIGNIHDNKLEDGNDL